MTATKTMKRQGNTRPKRGGKILVCAWAEMPFVSAIDSAASRIAFGDRSKYLRIALEEKLSRDVMKFAAEDAEKLRIARKVRRATKLTNYSDGEVVKA